MIDRESNIKLCGGSSDSAVACTTDEQVRACNVCCDCWRNIILRHSTSMD